MTRNRCAQIASRTRDERRRLSRSNVRAAWLAMAAVLASTAGACAPSGGLLDEDGLAAQGIVPVSSDKVEPLFRASEGAKGDPIALSADGEPVALTGNLRDPDAYDLFAFGPAAAGDEWTIEQVSGAGAFRVAIFDQDLDLLTLSTHTRETLLSLILRRDATAIFVGVSPVNGSGGDYRLRVRRVADTPIPAPRQQVVWINFGGNGDLTVGDREHLTFGPFDGSSLGDRYIGQTDAIKQAIVATVREAYASYDVVVLTSDETLRPAGPHSIVYVGGYDESLLGLADHVDPYNARLSQTAIVFAERFAAYKALQLDAAGIGRMIGNSAAHELGHLLGLYHTADAGSIMDTHTGNARNLSGVRTFGRVVLDAEVFPIGALDPQEALEDGVGIAVQ